MNVEKILSIKRNIATDSRPAIFNLQDKKDGNTLARLFSLRKIHHVVDDYEEELREYFAITNPALVYTPDFEKKFREYLGGLQKKTPLWQRGRWVYFSWLSAVSHILEDAQFQEVRTARNRNLITTGEQKKFYNAVIGIAGLSVGNSVALAIVLQGGGRRIRLADHDRLALSNINRIRVGVQNLGLLKAEMTAREIYTINPYAEVEIFQEGLDEKNIGKFFTGPPKLDIMIDEIDNLGVKYLIREQAKKRRVPVVMAADNGDSGVIDIERYDKNPNLPFFHGRIGKVTYEGLFNLNKFEAGEMIAKLIDFKNIPRKMWKSFREIGKTLVSWPQLGGTALLNGVAVAYCIRKIINRQPLKGNRAIISLDRLI